ncbi:MAG TPA: hypothetical protein VFX92_03025 [Candidatus Krumholzibacteria bacterium]|nr:hypothetical protein [Candidatus Krumholzibacteria bacterium]
MRIPAVVAATVMLALTGCSDDARMQIQVVPSSPNGYPEIRASWPQWPATHTVVLDSTHTSTGRFDTATSGTFRINFVLLSDGVETTTRGTVDIPLRGDWGWSIDFWLMEEDPADLCFGCSGSTAFDVDSLPGLDPGVKLWVVWGGNSISNPVTY